MLGTLYAVFHADGQDSQPFVGIAETEEDALVLARNYDQSMDFDEALYAEMLKNSAAEGVEPERWERWLSNASYYSHRSFFIVMTLDGVPMNQYTSRRYCDCLGVTLV